MQTHFPAFGKKFDAIRSCVPRFLRYSYHVESATRQDSSGRGNVVNSPTGVGRGWGCLGQIETCTGIAAAVRCEASWRNVMMCCVYHALKEYDSDSAVGLNLQVGDQITNSLACHTADWLPSFVLFTNVINAVHGRAAVTLPPNMSMGISSKSANRAGRACRMRKLASYPLLVTQMEPGTILQAGWFQLQSYLEDLHSYKATYRSRPLAT